MCRTGYWPTATGESYDERSEEVTPLLTPHPQSFAPRIILLTSNSAPPPPTPHRLQQIFTNVVTNAIKYTMEGRITLNFYWDKAGNGVFACKDTGPGIPPSQQKELFRRFVQRGGAPGTGLGLAIAKHLVDLAGGTIKFVSDPSVKAGTDCIVTIPFQMCEVRACCWQLCLGFPSTLTHEHLSPCDLPRSPQPSEQPKPVKITETIKESLRFLIIDDITMNRAMLRRRLLKNIAPNSSVMEAVNGEEALKICASTPQEFDIIVVDQYMEEAGGVMLGTDVVMAMRRNGIKSIVIGCSGNDTEDHFMEAGCQAVWKKPMPNNQETITQLSFLIEQRARNAGQDKMDTTKN